MSVPLSSVIDAIGQTPLVELRRLGAALKLEGRLLAKLDYLLPGFSKKDRAAKAIIEAARDTGELGPGQTVVELTSGNMGTGLAIVCGVLGHPFVAVMSEGNSEERARMMRALGAEVVLVPQAEGAGHGEVSGADLALVEEAAQRITQERGAFRADQFAREGNPRAHETGTAPEIWEQSGGTVTALCDFVGSGGTLGGAARFFGEGGCGVTRWSLMARGIRSRAGGIRCPSCATSMASIWPEQRLYRGPRRPRTRDCWRGLKGSLAGIPPGRTWPPRCGF